ncbi:MAG: DUF4440 domain-containing protein [Myxococcaceae bacterium]|nr:DUF4440 domain-containing protein [Myxococcaceae bacterium]
MNRTWLVSLAAAALASACAPHKIAGTEIDDTDDTRAILDVMEKYRHAMEKKDAKTVVSLLDESFRDEGGTASPDDDLDYESAPTKLPALFASVEDIKMDMLVRKIDFNDDTKTATATFTYTESFKLPRYTSKPQSESDIKQMTLKRTGKDLWKIVSGI